MITHVQDIYTVLRDRLEWLLYRPLYRLRGTDLSPVASYNEPCSWRAFSTCSQVAAPNLWPPLHAWPEYARWTPFHYRYHGVFVPWPITLLGRTEYWWLDVYDPHGPRSYDNSTWWCFNCHHPYDAARLRAASLRCRREESHRYTMLSITSPGHLVGDFKGLLLLQKALGDVDQRCLYKWVPTTSPDELSAEFRVVTWGEFSIDAHLADAQSGFEEWPTPSEWSLFFVHARFNYALDPPHCPELLSTSVSSPSPSLPSSPFRPDCCGRSSLRGMP